LISLPPLVAGVAAFVLLDMAVYWQHRWFHTLGPLWRLHRVHHADKALDASSGLRFHPVEILMSLGIKAALIIAIGAPPAAVLVFELVLNGAAMFNHANARMPLAIDRWLRLVLVTPDMHRVHHSLRPDETMRNFGFNLPWWDRWFGTYKAEPDAGHDAMVIGLPEFVDEPRTSRLWWMLRSPLQK
jgi:sterol desaturase/sphingolipid hydroxylase (fatty acid hydroxylase superfamily)